METMNAFIQKYPGYALASQYAPVTPEMNSVIGFFNYFDQIFRGSQTDVRLHLFFFDREGREVGVRSIPVPALGAIQFDARREGIVSDGMVAVAAIPERDIHLINEGRVQIKPRVNTGFYIKWEGGAGGRDLMHEWASIQSQPKVRELHHVGVVRTRNPLEHGLVLMNPVALAGALSTPTLKLRESGQRSALAEAVLPPIAPMGTQVVRLSSVFPDFDQLLTSGRKWVVDVVAENLSPPLTAEWHPGGDFHLHHI